MILATEEEVRIFRNMFCGIKSIVSKIKKLTCLLLCCSFVNAYYMISKLISKITITEVKSTNTINAQTYDNYYSYACFP